MNLLERAHEIYELVDEICRLKIGTNSTVLNSGSGEHSVLSMESTQHSEIVSDSGVVHILLERNKRALQNANNSKCSALSKRLMTTSSSTAAPSNETAPNDSETLGVASESTFIERRLLDEFEPPIFGLLDTSPELDLLDEYAQGMSQAFPAANSNSNSNNTSTTNSINTNTSNASALSNSGNTPTINFANPFPILEQTPLEQEISKNRRLHKEISLLIIKLHELEEREQTRARQIEEQKGSTLQAIRRLEQQNQHQEKTIQSLQEELNNLKRTQKKKH